ncbi:MAG: hypothetical protein KA498_09445 [Neisseriaceae bacterium]|nr:hypothetical protein [Neisseriaceae bacterium]
MIAHLTTALRQRFPMLWNIRIVPMTLIILGLYAFLFTLGFLFQGNTLEHIESNSPSIYFLAFISGLLVFIGWLMVYSRNNGFRFFAPRSVGQLWGEWAIVLFITSSLCALPLAYTAGAISRIHGGSNVAEAQKNRRLLDAIQILMPYDIEPYRYVSGQHQPLPIPSTLTLQPKTLPMDDYAVRANAGPNDQLIITGYKGTSLLFFHHLDSNNPLTVSQQQLLTWLRNGQSEPILALMHDYQQLLQTHQRHMSRSPEAWWASLNQPPFYILSDGDDNTPVPTIRPMDYQEYRDWEALSERQNVILDQDTYRFNWLWLPLSLALFWGLMLSLAVFSFRLSSGKTWLKAALSAGVLLLLSGFLSASHSGNGTFSFFWVVVWTGTLAFMLYLCRTGRPKGPSTIAMHFLFWLPPWLLLVLFDAISNSRDDELFEPFGLTYLSTTWLVMCLLMPFLIVLVRRWKALPEA